MKLYEDGNDNVTLTLPKANSFFGIGTTTFTDGTDTFRLSVKGAIRAEGVNVAHEDLVGKSVNIQGGNPSSTSMYHGTKVALVAGASTDNNKGMASIGFNSNIKASNYGYSGLIPLANSGARVINMSWGSCNNLHLSSQYGQAIMDQVYNSGVVLVAAAGNGSWSCSSLGPSGNHYPASLNHVISVTGVGHQYDIGTPNVPEEQWKDVFLSTLPPFYTTYNVNVDISAPERNILTAATYVNGVTMYKYDRGTSFSAPIVTGTIGLMFGANTCLFPDEVESIPEGLKKIMKKVLDDEQGLRVLSDLLIIKGTPKK